MAIQSVLLVIPSSKLKIMIVEKLHKLFLKSPQVSTDTRHSIENSIFFAISSDNKVNKGNQFAETAIQENGSSYAIIDDKELKAKHLDDHRYILVDDSLVMLQELAKYHRKYLGLTIIAVAGSNGKTTNKEILKRILARKYKVGATMKNLNNQIGVPLTILSFTEEHEIGVIEMGANHLYETKALCEIAQPNFGIVTNCGKDHLEGYGSVENVIKANCELYEYLALTDGIAFVNADDITLLKESGIIRNRIYYGSLDKSKVKIYGKCQNSPWLVADVTVNDSQHHLKFRVKSNLFGSFWLPTILAGFAVGNYFGVSSDIIRMAIESYDSIGSKRTEKYRWNGSDVLLDCYNANPSSMEAFVKEVIDYTIEVEKVFVLGTMLEGGVNTVLEHKKILELLIENGVRNVILVDDKQEKCFKKALDQLDGEHSFKYFSTVLDAKNYFENDEIRPCGHFFVKGSNRVNLTLLFDYEIAKNEN